MTQTPPTPSSDMVPVYLKVANFDGTPVNALVRFTPSFTRLDDNTDDLVVIGKPITAPVTAGVMSYAVPATDDPDFSDLTWTYKVEELFPGGSTYHVAVPIATKDTGGINLRTAAKIGDVTPTDESVYLAALSAMGDQVQSIMQYAVFNPPTGEAIVIAGT